MYLKDKQKRSEELYNIIERESLENQTELKTRETVITYEVEEYLQKLTQESDIAALEKLIKESHNKIGLIKQLILEKAMKKKLKLEKEKGVAELKEKQNKIEERKQEVNACAKFTLGELVDEINKLTGKNYKIEILNFKGEICSLVNSNDFFKADTILYPVERAVEFDVAIGPFVLRVNSNIEDKTETGLTLLSALTRTKFFESIKAQSDLTISKQNRRDVVVTLSIKEVQNIINEDIIYFKNPQDRILSQAISNIVELKDNKENSL